MYIGTLVSADGEVPPVKERVATVPLTEMPVTVNGVGVGVTPVPLVVIPHSAQPSGADGNVTGHDPVGLVAVTVVPPSDTVPKKLIDW
jgi:hypothetical protein